MKTIFILILILTNIYASKYHPLNSFDYSETKRFEKKSTLENVFSLFKFTNNFNKEETENFIIYWGNKTPGTNVSSILALDKNNNGITDFIDITKESLEYSLSKFKELNFSLNTEEKIEILIANTELYEDGNLIELDDGVLGLSSTSKNRIYLNANINYSQYPATTTPEEVLKITIAHELFHIIQTNLKVDFKDTNMFIYEGSAVWAEKYVYPDIDDYIYAYGEDLNSSLINGLGSNSGFNIYATSYFYYYLTNKFGNQIIKSVFDEFSNNTYNGLYTLNEVLKTFNSSLSKELYSFIKYLQSDNIDNQDFIKLKNYFTDNYLNIIENTNIYCNQTKEIQKANFSYIKINGTCEGYLLTSEMLNNINHNNHVFSAKGINLSKESDNFILVSFNDFENLETNSKYNTSITPIDSYNHVIKKGWNLVSSIYDLDINDLNKDKINFIWSYSDDSWSVYTKENISHNLENISQIKAENGIWINSSEDFVLSIPIKNQGKCTFDNIKSGWNLWANSCNLYLDINSLNLDYKFIWEYNNSSTFQWAVKTKENIIHDYPEIETLKKGKGYWILLN